MKEKIRLWFAQNRDYLLGFGLALIGVFIIAILILKPYILSNMSMKDIRSYTMVTSIFFGRYGQWNMILSTLIIMIGTTYLFYQKISSGYFKNEVLVLPYRKSLFQNILSCYRKAFLLYPLLFLLTFGISVIFFKTPLDGQSLMYFPCYFPSHNILNPIVYIFVCSILVYGFSLIIINITLIVVRYIRKFGLAMIVSFLSINLYNFVLGVFSITWKGTGPFNFYDAFFLPHEDELPLVSMMVLITWVISTVILVIVYHNREKMYLSEG